jgi:hypothetical protein
MTLRVEVDPRAIVWLERLGQFKKSNDLIGNRTRDLKELGAKYLENVGASTSHNFKGLHGLLRGYSFTRPFVEQRCKYFKKIKKK